MSDVYAVDIASTAVTAQIDLAELTPADDRPIEIVGIFLHQTTDFGDAAEEVLSLEIIRGHTTSGSGGNTPTPRPLKRGAQAAGFTAETLNTTIASAGTTHTLLADGWNVRVPYLFQAIREDEAPQASQADTTMVVRMSAPADSITVRGTVWVRELA